VFRDRDAARKNEDDVIARSLHLPNRPNWPKATKGDNARTNSGEMPGRYPFWEPGNFRDDQYDSGSDMAKGYAQDSAPVDWWAA